MSPPPIPPPHRQNRSNLPLGPGGKPHDKLRYVNVAKTLSEHIEKHNHDHNGNPEMVYRTFVDSASHYWRNKRAMDILENLLYEHLPAEYGTLTYHACLHETTAAPKIQTIVETASQNTALAVFSQTENHWALRKLLEEKMRSKLRGKKKQSKTGTVRDAQQTRSRTQKRSIVERSKSPPAPSHQLSVFAELNASRHDGALNNAINERSSDENHCPNLPPADGDDDEIIREVKQYLSKRNAQKKKSSVSKSSSGLKGELRSPRNGSGTGHGDKCSDNSGLSSEDAELGDNSSDDEIVQDLGRKRKKNSVHALTVKGAAFKRQRAGNSIGGSAVRSKAPNRSTAPLHPRASRSRLHKVFREAGSSSDRRGGRR